ncbi:hypothetical protein LZ31DRAFT_476110, partial [Colletotrichum somersetense]
KQTYNTRYSLVVTDPTTNPALTGLSMGERTGSRVFQWVWSYVSKRGVRVDYISYFLELKSSYQIPRYCAFRDTPDLKHVASTFVTLFLPQ